MKLNYRPMDLKLAHAFTISRGTKTTKTSVLAIVEHEGITGYGEAAPSERYQETPLSVFDFLKKVDISRFSDPFCLEEILSYVQELEPGNAAAKASIDVALHDWIGKRLGLPLWKLWGLAREKAPLTSFTIGIDSAEVITRKVQEAEGFPILKVKLGSPDDRSIIRTIRGLTDKVIRVDANEGWKSKEEALDKVLWLEEMGVEIVEQPLASHDLAGTAWLRERSRIPLIADESVRSPRDIPRLAGIFHGINIKLAKCGGLREAVKMVNIARAMDLKVMLGCMVESSVGISAAAQLSPLADYTDLDGNLLITNDPFDGVKGFRGRLTLSERPGVGVEVGTF